MSESEASSSKNNKKKEKKEHKERPKSQDKEEKSKISAKSSSGVEIAVKEGYLTVHGKNVLNVSYKVYYASRKLWLLTIWLEQS